MATNSFTVIMSQNGNNTLALPSGFVNKYGKELSEVVKFTNPEDLTWRVEVTKGKNEFWFDGDWKKFVGDHAINNGDKLEFEYKGTFQGTSNFSVKVFREIQYPRYKPRHRQEMPRREMQHDDTISHLLPIPRQNMSKRPGTSKKDMARHSPVSSHQPSKNRKIEENSEANAIIRSKKFQCQYVNATVESRRAVNKAYESKPEGVSFVIILQDSCIGVNSCLSLPSKFYRSYLNDPIEEIKLRLSSGVEYSISVRKQYFGNSERMSLTSGWANFVKDNELETGDVCLFELISPLTVAGTVVLKAWIFRAESD